MKITKLILPILFAINFHSRPVIAVENFKFHLNSEPKSLDPAQVSMGESVGYLYQNIYQGLYVYRQKQLVAVGAKNCQKTALSLKCELNPDFQWSDGKRVEASEYVLAFRHLLSYKSKNPIIRLLKNIKNADKVFSGEMKPEELGVSAPDKLHLQFKFERNDPDFLYKLTSPLVAPIRSESFVEPENASRLLVTGPYKIESWTKSKRIVLTENEKYLNFKKQKPKVEIFFVDDDQTALLLYEAHKINFLRMLPTALIPEYKSRVDFKQVPMARFDYIGFSPELKDATILREALAKSLNFGELKKIFSALGMPGCSSLPTDYMAEPVCVDYDLEKAKKLFAELPKAVREKTYHLAFSNYDRDDVLRGMQWVAEQWKTHLGLKIEIEKLESGVFNSRLKDSVPDIFRKSVIVDRPTCLAAIENFGSNGSESFLKLETKNIDEIVDKMSLSPRPQLCTEALRELLLKYQMIGLGQIHFTMLASPQFTNWQINELNGLDLSRLSFDPTQAAQP